MPSPPVSLETQPRWYLVAKVCWTALLPRVLVKSSQEETTACILWRAAAHCWIHQHLTAVGSLIYFEVSYFSSGTLKYRCWIFYFGKKKKKKKLLPTDWYFHHGISFNGKKWRKTRVDLQSYNIFLLPSPPHQPLSHGELLWCPKVRWCGFQSQRYFLTLMFPRHFTRIQL